MPTLYGDLKLRPTRIGFLVRPSNLSNLRKVFQICSCLWGGMYNPIIPVSRSLPAAWQRDNRGRLSGRQLAMGYIRFFEPDVFVETEPGLAQSVGITDDTQHPLHSRVISFDDLGGAHRPEFKFGLHIFDVYRELHRTTFQFVRRHDSFVALFRGRSRHGAYLDATFGGFPKHKVLSYIQQGYEEVFDPTILKHELSAWLRLNNEGGRTPLTFTHHALERRFDIERDRTIFVANPTSPLDLLDLWNLRLTGRQVLPVNSEWLPDLKDYLHEFIVRNHGPLPGNPHGVMIRTTVEIGNSFSREKAEHLVRDTFADLPNDSYSTKLWYDSIWQNNDNDAIVSTRPVQISAESSRLDLPVPMEDRPSIQFQTLTPEFASEFGHGEARWVNVISLRDFLNQHRFALALPSTSVLSPYYQLRVGHPLLVSKEGFVLLQGHKYHQESMQLLLGSDAIIDWFKRHAIKAEVSDAGRVSNQILSSIGGFIGVEHILKNKATLELLNRMANSQKRTATVGEWQQIKNSLGQKGFWSENYLDQLVGAGALKLGLSVPCPNCTKENWYGLDDLAEMVSCERCLKDFRFPQGKPNFRNSWKYRVVGPYSVPNYASGSYATVLALNCIASGLGFGDNTITFSTELNLEMNGDCSEIDFACWFQRERYIEERNEPVFLVGEAKSFAKGSFSKEDVDRMKRVGQKIPGTFLVFATLKSELSTTERDQIRRLATWGRSPDASGLPRNPVIVLTGTELFSPDQIKWTWEKVGGKRQALAEPGHIRMDNLRTLSDLTQQVYLELQPTDEWLEEYWRRRFADKT